MNDIVTDNYVGRYLGSYKPVPLKPLTLQAVEIHTPKKINTLFEMMHCALEHLGILGKDDTWSFEYEPEYTGIVVYDKKGKDVLSFGVNLNQPTIVLYRNRYGTVINGHNSPRYGDYDDYGVMFNILELTPTEEVEVKPEVKEPVEPATTYTETTPVKSDLSFDGLDRDYVGEDESVPKKKHSEYYSNDDGIEAIYIIEYCHLHFSLGNVLKYLMRAGKKTPSKVSDYQKASWYLNYLLNSRDLLREQFDALEPYFDRSGAIIKLVEDVPLNNTLCEILSIYRFYSSFSEFEYALKKMYHGLNLAITAEVRRDLE